MAFLIRKALGGAPSLGLSVDDKTRLDEMLTLVEQATSDFLISVDWSANMLLVDQINATGNPVILQEVVRYLRKRIQDKDARVVMNALTLVETLVMNCHSMLHAEIAKEKFMSAVARVARDNAVRADRESLELGEKSLELIQTWGEAFLPHRDRLPWFVDTYHELKREGFRFPVDDTRAPVFTPPPQPSPSKPKSVAGHRDKAALGETVLSSDVQESGEARPNVVGNHDWSAHPNSVILEAVSAAEMLDSLLESASSAASSGVGDPLARELAKRCEKLRPSLHALVVAGEGGDLSLDEILAANDCLNRSLERFSRCVDDAEAGESAGVDPTVQMESSAPPDFLDADDTHGRPSERLDAAAPPAASFPLLPPPRMDTGARKAHSISIDHEKVNQAGAAVAPAALSISTAAQSNSALGGNMEATATEAADFLGSLSLEPAGTQAAFQGSSGAGNPFEGLCDVGAPATELLQSESETPSRQEPFADLKW